VSYQDDHRETAKLNGKQRENLGGRERDPLHDMPADLRMLDIGCGTGLASDSLLKAAVGSRVRAIDLLDISPEMLRRVSQCASRWPAPATCHRGGQKNPASEPFSKKKLPLTSLPGFHS
jgi:SAM-dependent methyltransferase